MQSSFNRIFSYIKTKSGNPVGDISVITHQFERRSAFRKQDVAYPGNTLFVLLLLELQKRNVVGNIRLVDVGDPIKTKIALLHVDVTQVPDEYLAYAEKFPVCINGSVKDISKKMISEAVLDRSSLWQGPVIVKSNLNCNGKPELKINKRAICQDFKPPYPDVKSITNYVIYDSILKVPEEILNNPDAVVEKFIPEQDARGFTL